VDEGFACLVRGPSSRYPRGFMWVVPVWFALLAAVVLLGSKRLGSMPPWFAVTELGGLLLAWLTTLCVLATVRRRAFFADRHGIWLGVRSSRRRPGRRQVHLVWPEVAQLRIVPRRYGLLLEITLGPAARIVHRYGVASQAGLLLGALFVPVGGGRGHPALTTARTDPPRYVVKVCDMTPAELRARLASVMPDDVAFRVLKSKAALRFDASRRAARTWPAASVRR
jgi:hypothetical protein